MLEDQSYLALWFGRGNLFLISGGTEKKLWDFQNAQTVSLQNSCYIKGEVCCSYDLFVLRQFKGKIIYVRLSEVK